jgi:hypothetical protein
MKWMGGPGRFTNSGSIARRLRPPQSKVQLQFCKAHDSRSAGKLLSCLKSGTMLLADHGYDADWITALAAERVGWANIPPRRNRNEPICLVWARSPGDL